MSGHNPSSLSSMRKWGVLICTLLIALPLFAMETRVSSDRQTHLEYDVHEDAGSLQVETENGDIIVTGSDEQRLIVDAHVVVAGFKLDICRRLAEQVEIKIETTGGCVEITAEKPKKFGYHYSIGYTVRTPRRLSVEAQSVNGELTLTGVQGGIKVESVNGSVHANSVTGNIEASTVNGGLMMADISTSKIDASTVNGQITIVCKEVSPAKVGISTVNGSIDLTLPSKLDAHFDASTVNGSIRLDLGLGKVASKSRGDLEMDVGSGAGKYDLSSVNGAISVSVAGPE